MGHGLNIECIELVVIVPHRIKEDPWANQTKFMVRE